MWSASEPVLCKLEPACNFLVNRLRDYHAVSECFPCGNAVEATALRRPTTDWDTRRWSRDITVAFYSRLG